MELIKTENLMYQLGKKKILEDINISIQKREHSIIFGLNGSGKTTLLSVLSGYRRYSEGNVYLFEQKVTPQNIDELRKKIGFISSSYFNSYYKYESALDIVLSGLYGSLGMNFSINSKDVRRAKMLLEILQLEKSGRYPYMYLSRGQQQKVLIARALINSPEILMLDESCEGLDILARGYFWNSIRALIQETGITIVMVSHYTNEFFPFLQKVILLKKGKVYLQGHVNEVLTNENISKFFGRSSVVEKKHQGWNIFVDPDYKLDPTIWYRR